MIVIGEIILEIYGWRGIEWWYDWVWIGDFWSCILSTYIHNNSTYHGIIDPIVWKNIIVLDFGFRVNIVTSMGESDALILGGWWATIGWV
jgi:hypothetical protein